MNDGISETTFSKQTLRNALTKSQGQLTGEEKKAREYLASAGGKKVQAVAYELLPQAQKDAVDVRFNPDGKPLPF